MAPQKKGDRTKRRKAAFEAVTKAIEEGCGTSNIKLILKKDASDRDLGKDYYKILTTDDLFAVSQHALDTLSAHNSTHKQTSTFVKPEAPMPPAARGSDTNYRRMQGRTPVAGAPPTPPLDDHGVQEQRHARGTAQAAAGGSVSPTAGNSSDFRPSYADKERNIDIALFQPNTRNFILASAGFCEQEQSFISFDLLKRENLFPEGDYAEGLVIKLAWKYQNPTDGDTKKTPKTTFWIVRDNKIEHDIAIGTAYNRPDPLLVDRDSFSYDEAQSDRDSNAAVKEESQALASQDYINSMTRHSVPASADLELYRRLGQMQVGALEAIEGRTFSPCSTINQGSLPRRSHSRGRSRAQSSISSRSSHNTGYY